MSSQSALMLKHYGTDDSKKIDAIIKEKHEARDALKPKELVKMPFPYYAPSDSLPPIPTAEDVEKAQTEEYTTSDRATAITHVYRVNTVYAVKFSEAPDLITQEAENLLFLQDHEIKTHKVYAVFSHQGTDPLGLTKGGPPRYRPLPRSKLPTYYYMVMDFIDGVQVDHDMWEDFTPETRRKIYGKIGEQLQLLRSIPPPNPSYYGRIHCQPYPDTEVVIEAGFGPYHTYKDFLKGLWKTLELNFIGVNRPEDGKVRPEHHFLASQFFDCFEKSSKSAEPKLSHMGLDCHGLVLVPSALNPSNQIEDYDLLIVNWQFLSWMPAWVEAVGILERFQALEPGNHYLPLWEFSQKMKPFYYNQASRFVEYHCKFGRFT